jgi:sialic acid synthase SpsE
MLLFTDKVYRRYGLKEIFIDRRPIGNDKGVYVIAEIGINHEGDISMAKDLIAAAEHAGADAVKFQIVFADTLYPPSRRLKKDEKYYHDLFKRTELSFEEYAELKEVAEKAGMSFFASFNNREGVDYLGRLRSSAYKIASTQLNNLPLVDYAARQGGVLIIATGMASLGEVEDCIRTAKLAGNENLVLLHCVSSYPMPPEHANLAIMDTLQQAFDLPVGFSDHSIDGMASLAAVARGASVIERHFSIDPEREGFDHRLSSGPEHLKDIINKVRMIHRMIGSSEKKIIEGEQANRALCRVGLCAAVDINNGDVITEASISGARPAVGLEARYWRDLVGRKLRRNLKAGDNFKWSDIDDDAV